jgi:hypothetical protein
MRLNYWPTRNERWLLFSWDRRVHALTDLDGCVSRLADPRGDLYRLALGLDTYDPEPIRDSRDSANGPSVAMGIPSWTLTFVA